MTSWWRLSDDELLAQCDRDNYRSSGPGGQHRNRTDSAVRLTHRVTGVAVTAVERRSQHENLDVALIRLRRALAIERSASIEVDPPPDFIVASRRSGRLIAPKDKLTFLDVVSYLLSLFERHEGRLAETAQALDVSTSSLVKILQSDVDVWRRTQRIRVHFGHPTLK